MAAMTLTAPRLHGLGFFFFKPALRICTQIYGGWAGEARGRSDS